MAYPRCRVHRGRLPVSLCLAAGGLITDPGLSPLKMTKVIFLDDGGQCEAAEV